jgi:hypothetical protein
VPLYYKEGPHVSKGYIKVWRVEALFDLAMPHLQYKVWMALQIRAQHKPYRGRNPGDLQVSYNELRKMLEGTDGVQPAETEIREALKGLEKLGYIQRRVKPGLPMAIRINDWHGMQGVHPKGYGYHRPGHELPDEVYDDPFGPDSDWEEVGEGDPHSATGGKVVELPSDKRSRRRKNA